MEFEKQFGNRLESDYDDYVEFMYADVKNDFDKMIEFVEEIKKLL